IAITLQGALLVQHAPSAVSDAFFVALVWPRAGQARMGHCPRVWILTRLFNGQCPIRSYLTWQELNLKSSAVVRGHLFLSVREIERLIMANAPVD
ncbi:MAG: hypothetical protein ACPGU3_10020, partial [Litorivicinus sp.]